MQQNKAMEFMLHLIHFDSCRNSGPIVLLFKLQAEAGKKGKDMLSKQLLLQMKNH